MSIRKIKLLHIITHLELGGAQKTTLALIQRLNHENFEVHFITSPYGYLIRKLEEIKGIKFNLFPCLRREINLLNDFIAFLRLLKYIKHNRFDIVHTHSPKAGFLGRWAAKIAKVPIIIHTVHGFPFYENQKFILKKIYILMERITAKITDKLVVVCESDFKKGISAKIGSEDRYILIREGIEIVKQKQKKSLYNRLNISYSFPLIGMVACLKPQKAPLDFVKGAFLVKKRFPKAKFILVGGGPLYKEVKRLIRRLNLENNFSLLGWREDAIEIISLFDIFVLTSIWEGLPLVILEAMSLGKPIVATDVDGIRELIEDGENGFLVEPGDYYNLAQKIMFILEEENLRKKFTDRNIYTETLSKFNLDLMTRETENLYSKMLEVYYAH
ncbi:MAG: glycosyltransferase family 4 protein [Candidatus Omnitrophica bacterium]|nr:glycosyltransferase family 4 protein [Candidatus Omnitrophota bacterium]